MADTLNTENLLRLIAENTGKRINLGLDDLDQYLSVARAAIAEYRRSTSSVSEGEMPELPPPSIVDGPREYWSAEKVDVIVRKAREYQRRVDEKIIARQDSELCRLRAATKAAAPADAPVECKPCTSSDLVLNNSGNVNINRAPAEDAREEVPAELFDGHAVYSEITRRFGPGHGHDPDTVAATLDALARLIRARRASSVPAIPGTGGEPKPACRMQGGICACRSGGSYGGCAIARGITHQSIAAPSHPLEAKAGRTAKQLYERWAHSQPDRCSIPPWDKATPEARADWEAKAGEDA